MDWREEIAEGFPPYREGEPEDLRRDIEDEIADHLACAQQRELRGKEDEDMAFQSAIDHFGDPAKLARRLWRDAMRERLRGRRLLSGIFLSILILIFLAILLPSFLEARQIRANVLKAHGEMRSLAMALFDYDTALRSREDLGLSLFPNRIAAATSEQVSGFRYGRIEEVWPNLTSPVQAISSIPRDPFDPDGGSYRTATSDGRPIVIIGLGPDRDLDLTREVLEGPWMAESGEAPRIDIGAHLGCPGCGTVAEALRVGTLVYSPTNGAISNGDLIRYSQ